MKLQARTFRIQWDLHAWSGVICGLLLFVVFYTGLFALFHDQLEVWQEPDVMLMPRDPRPTDYEDILQRTRTLQPVPLGGTIGVLREPDAPLTEAWIYDRQSGVDESFRFDTRSGRTVPESTRLATELYYMHFFYRLPGGMEFAGLVAVGLGIATITGLFIQLNNLRRQLWQYRPSRDARVAGSDLHKVLGVFGLPFALAFAWSGALLGLASVLGAGLAAGAYRGDFERVEALHEGEAQTSLAAGRVPAPRRTALDDLVRRAQQAIGTSDAPAYVYTDDWGRASSRTHVVFEKTNFGQDRFVEFRATDGLLTRSSLDQVAPPAERFERVLFSLHFADYGGRMLELLYAVLALAVAAVCVSGNLIWLQRRDRMRAHWGNRLLERLTAGICAGLTFAVASYFATNRLLPRALDERGSIEFTCFLVVWALCVGVACWPRLGPVAVGRTLSRGAGAVFAATVLADIPRYSSLLGALSEAQRADFLFAESLLLLLALAAFGTARFFRKATPQPTRAPIPNLEPAQ